MILNMPVNEAHIEPSPVAPVHAFPGSPPPLVVRAQRCLPPDVLSDDRMNESNR